MDLCLDLNEYILNIRSAVMIIHNNKLLVHRNLNKNHFCIPGGRIELGEDSITTAKREIEEELQKEIEITGHIATIENFFKMDNRKYHEIMFVHKAEFINEDDKKIEYTMSNMEGNDYLKYVWLDLDNLDNYSILPVCVKDIFHAKSLPIHLYHDELHK